MRAYDVRAVVDALCDTGSVLELRPRFGHGMITALARIEGRAVGIVANNPSHLGGAIDTPGADKAARFLQLLRRVRRPGRVPLRHAGLHGRARVGERPARCGTWRGCS